MRFINPKIDFAFKNIFGSNKSREILISFLVIAQLGEKMEPLVERACLMD
jgi:hypothetical protein